MSKVGVLTLGPAGAGKTTFSNSLISYMQSKGRGAHLVNLDPAASPTEFSFTIDIRDLISVSDVQEELGLGPNGALIYCFEFLLENLDWLDEQIGDYADDYLIFDCPGQVELYSHVPVMPRLVKHLQEQLGFRLCCTYLLEAPFVIDRGKFFSGALSAMSTMIFLELPHINILSKLDLVKDTMKKRELKKFFNPDPMLLEDGSTDNIPAADSRSGDFISGNEKFKRLNQAIANLVDDFGMVQFLPLDCSDKDNNSTVELILSHIDDITQWAEGQEPKEPNDEIELDEDEF
ncbi:putative signal sequence-binding GTPase [Martiniozyma asiatica (nom. inval.)]|nr:putative signal sequence-binding GTPase [Martiniozyma asiatica]